MESIILPTTLTVAAAAALINLWLGIRIGQIRQREKISIGDGGNPALIARMRAQLNFAEFAPIIIILIALIELATGTTAWLWGAGAAFVVARILHPFGMDGWMPGRMIGVLVTMLLTLGLAITAVAIPYLTIETVETIETIQVG